MLDERKAAILTTVIDQYIRTAQPVGSRAIAEDVSVSSATVRSELAVLEAEGYLSQPHTSAGRIPTEKGYRHFVDHIDRASLPLLQGRRVVDFFGQLRGEIEQVMRDTAGLLANLTDYAAVVVDGSEEAVDVRSVQMIGLSERVAVLVAVLANGQVVKHTIGADYDIDDTSLDEANRLLQISLEGRPLSKAQPVQVSSDPRALPTNGENLAIAAHRLLISGGVENERVYVEGASRVVTSFEAVESVGRVLTILEQQLVVVSLLTNILDRGLSVAIGSETGVEPLADCSLVVSPYSIDGEHAGSIAVLGPTRMNYAQAMSAVATVSRQLSTRLSEG